MPLPLARTLDRRLRAVELPFEVGPDTRRRLVRLAELIDSWASRIQLTGDRHAEAILEHRILDALALASHLPGWGSLCDLGSGAGFPGLPLACVFPERSVVLVESRERRHHFQRLAIRELALPRVTALRGRAENLDPVRADLALAQAVAPPDQAVGLLRPWAKPGGWIGIALSAAQDSPQVDPAAFQEVQVREYEAPDGRNRRVWLGKIVD